MKNLEILKLFPEPVLKYKIENFNDFNNELSNYIYNLYENDKEKKLLNLMRVVGILQIFKYLKKTQYKINLH